MKIFALALLSLGLVCTTPSFAKEEKEDKKSKREMKEEAKKKEEEAKKKEDEAKKKADSLANYDATFTTTAAPVDADVAELKVLLNSGNEFVCKEVKLADGKIAAAIQNEKAKGRLSKAAVNKLIKSSEKFKLEKLAEKKEEKEAKEDKKDAKDKKDVKMIEEKKDK